MKHTDSHAWWKRNVKPVETKTENGITVIVYSAMWARGAEPQKNIHVTIKHTLVEYLFN